MLSRLKKLAGVAPLFAAAMICFAPPFARAAPPQAQPVAPAPAAAPAPAVTSTATATTAALRVGQHADYTRFVFDFSSLTPYTADRNGSSLVLTFTTPASVRAPRPHFNFVDSIAITRPDATTLRVALQIAPGATAKDYRLIDKVLVDVYAPHKEEPPKVAAAKKAPKPKAPAATKTAAAAPVAALTAAPVPAPAPAPPATAATAAAPAPAAPAAPAVNTTALAAAGPGIVVDKAPPEMPAAPAPAVEQDPTKISISTVEPTRLAVFTRADILWVVLDSEAAGAVPPDVSGPEAGLLGNAKVLRFKGGTAYRYTLPPNRYLNVEKHSLTWNILITDTQSQTPSNTQINVDYDDASHTSKLMTELQDASNPLEIQDPAAGDTLEVVPTLNQGERIDQARRFPEVEILPAAIGLAVRPLSDDVKINRIENFVMITAPNGINATPGAIGEASVAAAGDEDTARLFDFPSWRKGGITKLYRNRRLLEDKIAAADKPEERQDLLMKLALLYFANNFGQEAIGVFRLIEQENPDMDKNPNFVALRGAANAMAGHYDDALKDLSTPALAQHPEVNLWIGYAAAASEQWRMANRAFPTNNRLLLRYPDNISVPITIYMAESALRLGHTDAAKTLLASLDSMTGGLDDHYRAAIDYLKGEDARQSGRDDDAIKLWQPVAFGLDRLYHTKASLALANLRLEDKKITLKQAIDLVDSLRFAWRGDALEVQILQNLGDLKVQNKQFLSGLEDMKTAAALSEEMLDDAQPIRDDMSRVFSNIFVGGEAKDIAPLEAVSVYNEFSTLMPTGADATTATLNFADNLISIDLLDKAEKILEDAVKGGQLTPERTASVGEKLAAIYLLDSAPDKALSAIQETQNDAGDATLKSQRTLLKARALSQLNRTDEAIALLSQAGTKDALHLKADVLWHAKKWDQAAAAVEALIPPPGKALDDDDAQLVVNAAVAYKLAGDADNLARIKSAYAPSMQSTKMWPVFGVVTRTSEGSELADTDTLMKITGEVDMFKSFLDTYKSTKTN